MMKPISKGIAALMTIGCMALATDVARADISILASPAELNLRAKPGQSVSEVVRVLNKGDADFEFNAYAWEWWYNDKERKLFAPIGTFENQAASWVTVTPQRKRMKPGELLEVRVTVSVPADKRGSHFGVVFFEVTPPHPPGTPEDLKARVGLGARLGVLLEVKAFEGKEPPATNIAVENVAIEPPSESTPLKVTVGARNMGSFMDKPAGTVSLLERTTRKMRGKLTLSQARMLPGQNGNLEGNFTGRLRPGEYEAIVTLTYGNGGTSVSRQTFQVQ